MRWRCQKLVEPKPQHHFFVDLAFEGLGCTLGPLLLRGFGAILCFGPLLTAASTACSNRSQAPGSVSISFRFDFLEGVAMEFEDYAGNEFYDLVTKIPDDFKLALADFIINFGRLELALDLLIWWAAHLPNVHTGRTMTARLDVRPKCEMALALLSELCDSSPYESFKNLNTEINRLTKFRNATIHGWWQTFGKTAVVMSTRGKQEEPAALMSGEPFEVSDLIAAAAKASEIEKSIRAFVSERAPLPRKHEH